MLREVTSGNTVPTEILELSHMTQDADGGTIESKNIASIKVKKPKVVCKELKCHVG